MLPKTHVIIGFLVSLIIFLIFPEIGWINAAVIFLSSFLIDFDHYVYYVIKKKDLSLKKAVDYSVKQRDFLLSLSPEKRRGYKIGVMAFHGAETVLLLALMILVHRIFLFVLIGVLIHLILDLIDLYRCKLPLCIKLSQILNYRRNKNLKVIGEL